jgi:hypothetical protein
MTRRNSTRTTARSIESDRKAQAAALMAMAWNMALPASYRLAAMECAEMLLRDAGDRTIPFTIDSAGDVRKTYWSIVLACWTAMADRITSGRFAQKVVEVAARGYRAILETQIAVRRAEAEFAPRVLSAVLVLQAAHALRAEAEELGRHGA